eukprot:1161671-Pelagomonas_calceolata.AAC.33
MSEESGAGLCMGAGYAEPSSNWKGGAVSAQMGVGYADPASKWSSVCRWELAMQTLQACGGIGQN